MTHSKLSKLLACSFIASTLFFNINASADPGQDTSIANGIRNIVNAHKYKATIGIDIQSLQTGQTYFTRDTHHLFSPASIQKLITVSAALLFLKPNFIFETKLLTNGTITQGVLNGNLYLRFSGDPTLTRSDLFNLFKALKARGIQRINGQVVIDDMAFDHAPYPSGWSWNDLSFDYAAPLSTIIIDRNRFGMRFVPARPGQPIAVHTNLPSGIIKIFNHVMTTRYNTRSCPMKIFSNNQNEFAIRGCLAKSGGAQGRALAVRNLLPLTKDYVKQALSQQNIVFNGVVSEAKAPADTTVLAQFNSPPLQTLIIHLLKKSDNLYANALLKKMGEVYYHQPGSWQNGLMAEQNILRPYGVNTATVHLNDGAGLSNYNFVTPAFMSKVLWLIHHNSVLNTYLIPALPIAGDDGTLRWRMAKLGKHKCVRAKTGSTEDISSLAGFVQTYNHGVISFVIMVNNFTGPRFPYLSLENRIGEYLASR